MKIFIDSADTAEVRKYLSWGVCDGVTTNPTICLKAGVKGAEAMKERTLEIAQLVYPRPLSVEVTSDNPEEALSQARAFASWGTNIVIKVTITDRQGNALLPVIHKLVSEGVYLNVTAMTTFNQAILAAKAIASAMPDQEKNNGKAHFLSVFGGRISEEHGVEHAMNVLRNVRQWLDFHQYKKLELLVGSVRTPENVELWSRSGAHILTIPPEVIAKSLLSARTKETVTQFIEDAKKAQEAM